MMCVDDIILSDYTVSTGEIVKPENVLFSSKVSKNRVCIYLTEKG